MGPRPEIVYVVLILLYNTYVLGRPPLPLRDCGLGCCSEKVVKNTRSEWPLRVCYTDVLVGRSDRIVAAEEKTKWYPGILVASGNPLMSFIFCHDIFRG